MSDSSLYPIVDKFVGITSQRRRNRVMEQLLGDFDQPDDQLEGQEAEHYVRITGQSKFYLYRIVVAITAALALEIAMLVWFST